MPEQKARQCGRCWASTRISDEKFFCMFPACPYRKEADPFGEKRERIPGPQGGESVSQPAEEGRGNGKENR